MAVIFNFKCSSNEKMENLRDRMCKALVGSPAFKNDEIAVCDLQDDTFSLIVGESNDNDIGYDLHANDLN